MSLSPFSGEQIVQVTNPDPFAKPVLRSPVLHTPLWMISIAQLARLAYKLLRLMFRHPVITLMLGALCASWWRFGWPGPVALTMALCAGSVLWWQRWPDSWSARVAEPMRGRYRLWHYKRQWAALMTVSRLTIGYHGRILVPALDAVTSTGYVDRLSVRMVPGQSAEDFAGRTGNLAHGLKAQLCRIRTASPGRVTVELVIHDALAQVIPALPVPQHPDLHAIEVGRREDGQPWTVRPHGSHLLIAGSTGAGKASLLWGIIRGLLPAVRAGTARILGADPKLMELAYGRALFDAFGRYEADPDRITGMLEDTVTEMQARAGQLAGHHREHHPSREHPFTALFVDEVAFLTAYQADRKLRDRTLAALATLTTQGRAVGYSVIAALQDPRKDVLTIRNLFPDRIAMRLDEPEQVDMVLGDGARDRGALADQIPADPALGAGMAYVRLEADPDPVRVRAAWVSDQDITAMCRQYVTGPAWPMPAEVMT